MPWITEKPKPDPSLRGKGRCFWYGCIGPGHIAPSWMAATAATADMRFCALHAGESKRLFDEAESHLAAPRVGRWEQRPKTATTAVASPWLAAVIRDKAIREVEDLRDRDSGRKLAIEGLKKQP